MKEKGTRKVTRDDLQKIDDYLYEIPRSYRADMHVPARLFAHEHMIADIVDDRSLDQLVNVATLPGIQAYAYAMPDIHQGYGFPIGGVAAMAIDQGGVISPGGIGYDINCGVRLLAASATFHELKRQFEGLATALYNAVPSGVGRGGSVLLSPGELTKVLRYGAHHMLAMGYGQEADLELCEEQGAMDNADPDAISDRAKERGKDQLGTLGSGNHFLEIQRVAKIYDDSVARIFGLAEDQITIMIHCGSRGLGHQTCTDYVQRMMYSDYRTTIPLADPELIGAPFHSSLAQEYMLAMRAAANFGWANRQLITHHVRQAWQQVLGDQAQVHMVYDVSHNLGKQETHTIHDRSIEVIVHRKGATRAFGPGRPELPARYSRVGQPVLIPGTMGTASYVMVGTSESMDIAFGSSCHGAGRRMSRIQAKKAIRGSQLRGDLNKKGILVRCDSNAGLSEEAPQAYKDIDEVIEVVHNARLARRVVRLEPIAVIKGG